MRRAETSTNGIRQAGEPGLTTGPDPHPGRPENLAAWPWLEIPIFGRCLPMTAALSESEPVAAWQRSGSSPDDAAAAFFGAASPRGRAVLERSRRRDHRARGIDRRHTARSRRLATVQEGPPG